MKYILIENYLVIMFITAIIFCLILKIIFSQKLYLLNKILNTSSIEKNLKKGYAILKSENQIIKSIQTLKKLNNFDVTLKDGVMSVKKKL